MNAALHQLHGGRCRPRYVLDIATQDRTLLSDRVVDDILHLRDLLERAYGTPDGAQWVRETLRDAAAPPRTDRAESSASDSSTTTGQRHREDSSSGRGNAKRATVSGTSDSYSSQPPRRAGRDRLDRRQVPPRIFHAAESSGSDAPPFPPRISRHREHTQRLPPRVAYSSLENAPGADSPTSLQQMVEAVTAAATAAVDCHLAHMGLYPRSELASSHDFVTNARPLMTPASVATPPQPAGSVAPRPYPAAVPTDNAYSFVNPASVAPPPPPACSVAPTTHPTAVPTENAYPFVTPASVATPPPLTGSVAPTTHPAAVSMNNTYPVVAPTPVSAPLPPADSVVPTANPAPAPSRTAPPPATSFAPALNGPLTPPPPDGRILYDDSSSQASNTSSSLGLRADFVANLQAAYRTLDMRRVPRVQPLQVPPSTDRAAATQLLISSIRDAFSESFDVANPTGTVTMNSPVWVLGWHAPHLKLTKAAINANRDDTHDLHGLVDDLFSQLQERTMTGSSGPAAFKILLADFADYFDRAPRGAAHETLQKFGVRTGTPFSSYLRTLRVVVASTVEKGGPLAPSAEMAIELVRIRTAQQYPMLMPTLFPGDLATREKPYGSLASMWTAFANLKHNTSPAIDGGASASAPQASSLHAPPTIATPAISVASLQRHNSRAAGPPHDISHISHAHSRRDPFSVDYGLWPFNDRLRDC